MITNLLTYSRTLLLSPSLLHHQHPTPFIRSFQSAYNHAFISLILGKKRKRITNLHLTPLSTPTTHHNFKALGNPLTTLSYTTQPPPLLYLPSVLIFYHYIMSFFVSCDIFLLRVYFMWYKYTHPCSLLVNHFHGIEYLLPCFAFSFVLSKWITSLLALSNKYCFLFVFFVVVADFLILGISRTGDREASSFPLHCQFLVICSPTFVAWDTLVFW